MSNTEMSSADNPLDIDRLMREIRADVAARLPAHGDGDNLAPGTDVGGGAHTNTTSRLSGIGTLAAPLPRKDAYHLDEFLAYHDEDFIRNAYRALLGREPDPEGGSRYLAKIRSGELWRIEVLGRIRYSPEGRTADIPFHGLMFSFGMRTARRVPVVGRLLGILQYAWRLPDLARNHEILEGALFANREEMRRGVNAVVSEIEQALIQVRSSQSSHLARIDQFRTQLDALGKVLATKADQSIVDRRFGEFQVATKADQATIDRKLGELQANLLDVRTSAQILDAKLGDSASEVTRVARVLDAVRDENQDLGQRLAQLLPAKEFTTLVASTERSTGDLGRIANALEEVRARLRSQGADALPDSFPQQAELTRLIDESRRMNVMPGTNAESTGEHAITFPEGFYVAFEDRFRGARDDVKRRVAVYLPLVRAAGAGTREAPILDIGCGRGEWLDLLREHELVACGVDLNEVAVAGCRARGLDVLQANAIEHLRRRPPDSLGAVSAIHVIEHLPFAQQIELFDEARRVLRPGGIVIFETPNPENLVVGACGFYYDPTHIKPLPPEPFRVILESRGFERVNVIRLHPDSRAPDLGDNPDELTRLVAERLFGPQDFALVGFKA
jgi:SAM-dependent methyltransferase